MGDVATADGERNLHHMISHPTSARPYRVRTLGAAIAVAMLLGGTAACSSDADSKSAEKSSSATESKSDSTTESESGSDQGRPDGFPDDIPLPEFEEVKTITSPDSPDDYEFWSMVVVIDSTTQESGESLIADYTAQLEDAGYEMTETGSSNEAENEKWEISFRSNLGGTLTIDVTPN